MGLVVITYNCKAKFSQLFMLIVTLTRNDFKARDGPILSSTKGHRILSQNLVSKNGKRAMVLEVKSQLQYASESIRNILTVVSNELGSSSDYVSFPIVLLM